MLEQRCTDWTTPIGIAAGLGVRTTYNPDSTTASIVSGTLDALSSGILIYTGLVEVSGLHLIVDGELLLTGAFHSYSPMNSYLIGR